MVQQFTTAKHLLAAVAAAGTLAFGSLAGAQNPQGLADRGQGAVELYGAKRRHPLGHLRQVPQGPVALARHLADEPRPDQESAPDLSGRRRPARLRGRPAAAVADAQRRPRFATDARIGARHRGHPVHSARRPRAVPVEEPRHGTRRTGQHGGNSFRAQRRAPGPWPRRHRLRRRAGSEGGRLLVHLSPRSPDHHARRRQRAGL